MIYPQGQRHTGSADGPTETETTPGRVGMHLMNLADVFEAHGREILKNVRQDDPARLWFFVSGILAWDEAIDLGWDPSDDDLDLLAERIASALRARTADEGSASLDVAQLTTSAFGGQRSKAA
jgi:hypothetical protein